MPKKINKLDRKQHRVVEDWLRSKAAEITAGSLTARRVAGSSTSGR